MLCPWRPSWRRLVVDDGRVLSGEDGEGVEAAVEHDPVGRLLKVLVHQSYGLAALGGRKPEVAEHLRHVPLNRPLADSCHVTQQQADGGLEK